MSFDWNSNKFQHTHTQTRTHILLYNFKKFFKKIAFVYKFNKKITDIKHLTYIIANFNTNTLIHTYI